MASIKDDKGFNQGFQPTKALEIRTERRLRAIMKEMSLSPSSLIVELGCGTGEMSSLIAQKTPAKVIGIDICNSFIEKAKALYRYPNLEFRTIDILSLSNMSDVFAGNVDYFFGNGILHHLQSQIQIVLSNLANKLTNNGRLLFWEPNLYNPYIFSIFKIPFLKKLARLEPGEMAFRRSWIRRKLCLAGFKDIKIDYKDFLLPNTLSFLITTCIRFGEIAEHLPVVKYLAQSLFISARKENK